MAIQWKITYKYKGKERGICCMSKKTMIKEYLDIMENPFIEKISELKIWKNDIDYTETLNRFLSK